MALIFHFPPSLTITLVIIVSDIHISLMGVSTIFCQLKLDGDEVVAGMALVAIVTEWCRQWWPHGGMLPYPLSLLLISRWLFKLSICFRRFGYLSSSEVSFRLMDIFTKVAMKLFIYCTYWDLRTFSLIF